MPPAKQAHDFELTARNIAELENGDQVTRFFAMLGYDVDGATVLPHATVNMDTEDLSQRINKIKRIATDADQEIEILLFEVRSVTVALTQTIAQRFRQRPGNYLLVLTSDYETLDFVLLERIQTEGKGTGGLPRFVIRPRILTVKRRNPGVVALRVLKRFTFTESDGLYQWDKLRSAYSLAEWSEPDFNNRALFSDYYLKHRLADKTLNPAWGDDVRRVGGEAIRLIAGARERLASENEQKTRTDLIEPLFELMGFAFTASKPGNSDADKQDYSLFAPDKSDRPLALALVYKWNRNLDSADPERDKETPNENPGALVVSLLEKGDAPWVIMTNGKCWRLYSATASNKITNYYEIDLEEALFAPDHDREAAFKYWWLMFRREAFAGFLDKVLTDSLDYAKQVGERLKDRVFKQIFNNFAGGFIQYMGDQGIENADIDLDRVFHATMTFLYRLMFVLYAESLELVPVKEENGYGLHSLRAMKMQIADAAGKLIDQADGNLDEHFETDSTKLYERLRALFASIDEGDPAINLPVYNGGLFSAESASGVFLDQYAIPDVFLAVGLDRLARDVDDKTHDLVFIDFKSLGVRQLGSIYEGLLEFKLRLADQKLAVIKDGKRELYMPHAKAVKEKKNILDTVKSGQVYIENTRQERKATGSYYTPDYIVKYIVEHTVGPVLDEKFKALRPRLYDAQKRYRQHRDTVKARKDNQSPELFWTLDDMQQLADDCLSVRVLDPAMGSGHFLVEVVDYTSNRLIDFLNAWSENPVWALLERTRADILGDMERQGVSIDEGKLTRVVLLKRSVLKRCVYGVDLNEMAVELAKVSLWLDAFTLGAPLSFLDHHLKWGNSLIGARIEEVREALENRQQTLFASNKFAGVMLATDLMRQVSYLSDNTVSQVNASRSAYRSAADHLAPYKRVLDVYTSRWFGNAPDRKKGGIFDPTIEFLSRDDTQAWLENPKTKLPRNDYMKAADVADIALKAGGEQCFFHWELEFPEIFFAPSKPNAQDVQLIKGGGFDAVIGNPPYIRIQTMNSLNTVYFPQNFDVAKENYDIYSLFIERALALVSVQGRQGFIVPHKFFEATYGESLRDLLTKGKHLAEIVHFGHQQIFEGATTYTCLLILSRAGRDTFDFSQVQDLNSWQTGHAQHGVIQADAVTNQPWNLGVSSDTKVYERLRLIPTRLGEITSHIAQGIRTSANEVYVLEVVDDSDAHKIVAYSERLQRQVELERSGTRSFLKGREIKPYAINSSGSVVIIPYHLDGTDKASFIQESQMRKQFPLIYKYLAENKKYLENRENGRMQGSSWYAFIYPKNIEIMLSKKLLVPDIAGNASFAYDESGEYAFTSGYGILLSPETQEDVRYILALANSRVLDYFIKKVSTTLRGGYFRYFTQFIEQLPIVRISFTTPKSQRIELVEKGRKLYELCLSEGHACVLEFTAHHLERAETDVIHDLLAFLAQQMIDLNKQKQAEVKRFLDLLEKKLHIAAKSDGSTGIDSLTGKTIIQGYLGDYQKGEPETTFEDFYFRLHQNRTRFGVTLTAIKAELEDEYRKSLDMLLPIKTQLETTDALIDRVVYQLYGLTDDEIKLIEYPQFEQAVMSAREEVLKDKEIAADPDKAVQAIAAKIEPAAAQYFARVESEDAETSLQEALIEYQTLPDKVRTFMLTGEVLLAQAGLPDYSPVVISYAKAAETVLNERLFIPFRDAGYTPHDCNNEFFQKFMAGGRPITLGSMGILLGSRDETTFRAFVTTQYPGAASTIFAKDKLLALLDKTQVSARNGAAHDGVLTQDDAKAARQWAIEILGYV